MWCRLEPQTTAGGGRLAAGMPSLRGAGISTGCQGNAIKFQKGPPLGRGDEVPPSWHPNPPAPVANVLTPRLVALSSGRFSSVDPGCSPGRLAGSECTVRWRWWDRPSARATGLWDGMGRERGRSRRAACLFEIPASGGRAQERVGGAARWRLGRQAVTTPGRTGPGSSSPNPHTPLLGPAGSWQRRPTAHHHTQLVKLLAGVGLPVEKETQQPPLPDWGRLHLLPDPPPTPKEIEV
ncbi:hypothetical protein AAFF_G00099990 [Aldrovandia affinis]|uniref:Uncharacterized protein n=1 Tax=Aldrovandia affinis TaxID=143900 RepID=A0AAD7WBD0_9TELE|nr:hypothetical protein AAFF_G00099990 [Aldrovandia affinis]